MNPPAAGRRNALADVTGIRVGHHDRRADGYLTGTTVILAPDGGMVCGVDVRGGGPGTRETDLLAPTASVEKIHAIVLTGGSAYGLAAASGVAAELGARGIGLAVGGAPDQVVPLVPAAVIFDLGRGGDFAARPDEAFGRAATLAALAATPQDTGLLGDIGAGCGAVAGGLKGGIGQASALLPDGGVVAALVVVNAMGSLVDPASGVPWGAPLLLPDDGVDARTPAPEELSTLAASSGHAPGDGATGGGATAGGATGGGATAGYSVRNTTIGVIATDAALTKAQCTKLAGMGHDGLARAVNPVHTLFDGDTLFAASTASRPAPDAMALQAILVAAADVVTRAVVRALAAAPDVRTAGGSWRGYRSIVPAEVPAAPGGPERR